MPKSCPMPVLPGPVTHVAHQICSAQCPARISAKPRLSLLNRKSPVSTASGSALVWRLLRRMSCAGGTSSWRRKETCMGWKEDWLREGIEPLQLAGGGRPLVGGILDQLLGGRGEVLEGVVHALWKRQGHCRNLSQAVSPGYSSFD